MTVSIYKNVADTVGTNVDLFTVLTTNKWQHLTEKVRAEKDKKKRDKLKQQLLPAFTPSGVFKENERTDAGLVKHSGYICIDIDADDNPNITNWQSVVFELGKLPQIAFAGLSASGNGVFALIPIKHPHRHNLHFKAFQQSFAKRGLVIDPKCGNLSRLRFYSYNEHYYINKNAEPYIHLYKEPKVPKQTPVSYFSTLESDNSDVDALVREIVARGIDIVPDYNTWFNVGSALSNVPNGRQLFHTISQVGASKYNYKECNKQFDSLKPGKGITINTLFHIAKHHGITLKRKDSNNQFSHLNKPKHADNPKPNKEVCKQSQASLEQVEGSKAVGKVQVCYVHKDGTLYVPHPLGDNTFAVYTSVEQYNGRKGLPTIIEIDGVDTSNMIKRHINLTTLQIT